MVKQKIIKIIITLVFLAIGFIFAGGRDNKEVVKERQIFTQEIDTTKLEKYERKVIIKAKVGKGPGEIGVIGEGREEGPEGIAVDSAGNVFILDQINKRILKFSPNGKYQKLISIPNIESEFAGLENHLFMDENGNFYIRDRVARLGDRIKYKYDRNGNTLGREFDMPKSLLNMQGKCVTGNIGKIKADRDTVLYYYIYDSIVDRKNTINVHLPMRSGWEYVINPYSFIGFDKADNAYIAIKAWEDVPAWPPGECMERLLKRSEEQIVFKFNDEGQMVAMIKEKTSGIGFEFWTLGDDGALYLLRYSFKHVVTDELPDWVKNDSNMTAEQKKEWRREYMAPDGYVYVVKFSKVEEK